MSFKNVKQGDLVYGTIFGSGKVCNVLDLDSPFVFEVEYNAFGGIKVHYTIEGVPNWGNISEQTVFYKKDIDLMKYDFEAIDKTLRPKQILKLKILKRLLMRCPSGIWKSVEDECPQELFEDYISKEKFHLFKEMTEEKN